MYFAIFSVNRYPTLSFGLRDTVEISHATCVVALQPAEGAQSSSDKADSLNSTGDLALPGATPGDSPEPSNWAQQVHQAGRSLPGDNKTV